MAEDAKALTRTRSSSSSSRKRTNSLGSYTDTQCSGLASPEREMHATTDASGAAAPAWTGPRSGSAPPEGRSRMSALTCKSISDSHQADEKQLAGHQGVAEGLQVSAPEARQDRVQMDHQVDKLLLDGLTVSKDRLLLLRADLEMEKLFNDAARTRLRVAPPGFPPNLNSYQRLLIHRLADMWGITRELEPASCSISSGTTPVSPANVGSMISGTIILVKTEATKLPPVRIASLAPPSSPEQGPSASSAMVSLVSKAAGLALESSDLQPKLSTRTAEPRQLMHDAEVPPSATSPASLPLGSTISTASTSGSPSPASGPVRIMSRAANAAARAALNKSRSPSAGSGSQGMTFEEREAAYQQARMRIFNEAHRPAASAVEQTSGPPVMPSPQNIHDLQQQQQLLHQPMPSPLHGTSHNQVQQPQYDHQMQYAQLQTAAGPPHLNPALRPSAPVFVYQTAPPDHAYGSVSGQSQPEHFAYYPVQMQPEPNLHAGPPIQVTMPSPATSHAQRPRSQMADSPYSGAIAQASVSSASSPFARPTSSTSHSSQSSISTATSQSSIRTASTSSAQRSTLSANRGHVSPGVNLQPARQFSASTGPSMRRVRPTARPSIGSSSTRSNASMRSHHSQSSSSSPSVAGDSYASVQVASSQTSKSESSSPDRDNGDKVTASPEEIILPSPHATVPTRPDWIDTPAPFKQPPSSTSSASSVSSKDYTSDLTEEHLAIQRDDAHTPLSSTSGKLSGRGLEDINLNFDSVSDLASVIEDDQPYARSTPLPHSAPLPADVDSATFSARHDHSDRADTASQVSSSKSSRSKGTSSEPRVIENPPLRYDKIKGWTMLNSSSLSQINGNDPLTGTPYKTLTPGNQHKKPPSPAPSVASSSNWSQHAFQPTQLAPSQNIPQLLPQQQLQDVYRPRHPHQQSQHPPQHYVMMPVPVCYQNQTGSQPYPQSGFLSPQHQQAQQGPSPGPQPFQQGIQVPYYSPQPSQPGQYTGQRIQVIYQPMQHMQYMQPQQPVYGAFVPQQPTDGHIRGMTPADMIANGEMLYSYDLPRPVPRSGATLFDPNASS